MTPLTIFGLQPISYVSEIGISIKPDHQGPHLGPKTDMHVPQKTVFPSISCFVANISYSTLKLTPLIIFCYHLSHDISTIQNYQGPYQSPQTAMHTPQKHHFLSHLFLWLISGTLFQKLLHLPFLATTQLKPISYLSGIGISTNPNHQVPH